MNYIYIRYSTDKQDERQQMEDIRKYLESKGLSADRFERDEGVSGSKSYRDRKLMSLVSGMQRGDCLIVSEISRLGRTMGDLNRLVNDELKPRGVRLIAIKMGIDLDCGGMKAVDELMLSNFAFAAQLERELIVDRTKNALEARKRAGMEIGGTNRLWGKNTGADRRDALKSMRSASAVARRARSENNPENRAFRFFISDWESIHGEVRDWNAISESLNERGMVTATGLPFTPVRARAMYGKLMEGAL